MAMVVRVDVACYVQIITNGAGPFALLTQRRARVSSPQSQRVLVEFGRVIAYSIFLTKYRRMRSVVERAHLSCSCVCACVCLHAFGA